jgi:HEAT repeat protein
MLALIEVGYPAAGERLADILVHGGGYDRLSAALTMSAIDGQYWSLVQALGDGNVQTRRAAETVLLLHENSESVRALTDALSLPAERCRTGAARVLGRYSGEESRQHLLDILRNGEEQEAALAAFALGLRGEEESRVDLESALLEGDRPNPVTFIHALQDLGRPAALPALRSYLELPLRSEVRATAELAVTVLERVEASTR